MARRGRKSARRHLGFVGAIALGGLLACATIGGEAGGGDGLPNAGFGPFRATVQGELGNDHSPPNAVDDENHYLRDPSILHTSGPTSLDVAGYFAGVMPKMGGFAKATDPTNAIFLIHATDGRSFDRQTTVVVQPSLTWEGKTLGAPSALVVGSETWIYYAAEGGIGLAKSADGVTFTKNDAPVLGTSASGWDAGATPKSPGVVLLPDGTFDMFYEAKGAIGEATSNDGVTFARVGDAAALAAEPGGVVDAAADASDVGPFDGAAVGAPDPILATSAEGRTILRVYFRGTDTIGDTLIGLAARVVGDATLERAESPVYGTASPVDPDEPCVVDYDGFSLLFATERLGTTVFTEDTPAVGCAVAPATAVLPPPTPNP